MTAPLLDVLVKRPGAAFGAAFDDPAHGFLHPVDLDLARREHDAFVDTPTPRSSPKATLNASSASSACPCSRRSIPRALEVFP